MIYHRYNNKGFYTGSGNAQIDPLESEVQGKEIYLLPQNANFAELPIKSGSECHFWDGSKWISKQDVSKLKYYKKSDMSLKTYEQGEEPDLSEYTLIEPNKDLLYQIFKNSKWVADLDKYKQHYKILVKQKESEKVDSGFTYNENLIDSDEKAQNFISALLIAVNAGLVTELKGFTTKDNKDINLTASDIASIAGFCLAHVAGCHAWKRDLYKKIDLCLTIEDLGQIKILIG